MPIERQQTENSPSKVLLIGWDAADWQLIQPLIEQGLMPTTAKFLEDGAWGNLATTRPILSPLLWNTIATGKRPQQHGVLGFTEPNCDGTGIRPVSSTSRKCKALWNILSQNNLRSNIVGWYASHPAEPIQGVMVSNQFEQYSLRNGKATPVPEGSISPADITEELAEMRVLQSEIDASAILPFVPRAAELLSKSSHRLGKLQHMIAQTATVHATATHLMATTDWDFTAIYYEGIDRFGHEFMHYHPPKMEHVDEEEFDIYQHCMMGIYRFHDMLLEALLKLAGDDTAVILMSDHGYYNNHLRPDPREGKSGPVEWHRPFGILAARGPGIQQGTRLYGASIIDITPTLLQLIGLPAAYDMPGRVLAEILTEPTPLDRVESWEEIEGDAGLHPEEMRVDPAEAQAALEQLVALGYIDPPGEDVEKTIQDTINCNQLSLVQSLMDSQQYQEAIDILEQLDKPFFETPGIQLLLASSLIGIHDRIRARTTLEKLLEDNQEAPHMHMMLGTLEFADGNSEKALEHLSRVAVAKPRLPGLSVKLGEVYLATERYDLAIQAFEDALSIDEESPPAIEGLARSELMRGNSQRALDHALTAAELVHFFPRAHYIIGKASLNLGDYNGAVEALELAVKQAPNMQVAHDALSEAYRNLGQTDKAMASQLKAKGLLQG